MVINVAINGFGRIGRMVLRAGWNDKNINFVAVNDLTDTKTLAHLLKYDSVHGAFPEMVSSDKDSLIIGKKKVKVFAEKNFYTETLFGRRRYFPNINSRIPFLKNMAERTATNAPVQGTATADIIKLAIRYTEEDLKKAGLLGKTHLVLQVHDELVYEIEDKALLEAEKIIKNAMQTVLGRSYLHYKTDIPLVVHSGSGSNLGEVK